MKANLFFFKIVFRGFVSKLLYFLPGFSGENLPRQSGVIQMSDDRVEKQKIRFLGIA